MATMQMDALDAWIGATVKGVAALKGVPLKRVASELGLTPSALSNKIHGRNPWTAAQLAATARLLGVEVGELYNGYNGSVPFPAGGVADATPRSASTPEYGGGSTITAIDWDEIEHYVNEGVYA